MPDLWVPGMAGPLDDLVDRIHRQVARLADEEQVEQAFVEIELVDGVRYTVESIAAEPGYGFITIRPHREDGTPLEVIVPVGSIKRLEVSRAAEQHARLGFSLPPA